MTQTQEKTSPQAESGSTIIGVLGGLAALFFLYAGGQRIWWAFGLNAHDYVIYGIAYLLFASISIGGAFYGLSSKEKGVKNLALVSGLFGSVSFLGSSYFWYTGMVMDGGTTDVFYALSLSFGGVIFLVTSGITTWLGQRRGIISSDENQDHELAERIEERGDEINERIEKGGEEIDAQVRNLPNKIANTVSGSIIVGVGILLWVATFPLVGSQMEMITGLVIFFAWIAVPFGIYFDSITIRNQTESRTWWWVFVLFSLIPIGAILIGVFWLLWRRRMID